MKVQRFTNNLSMDICECRTKEEGYIIIQKLKKLDLKKIKHYDYRILNDWNILECEEILAWENSIKNF